MTKRFSHNEDAELDYRLRAAGYRIWMTDRTIWSIIRAPRSAACSAVSRLRPRPRQEHPQAPHDAEDPAVDAAAGVSGGLLARRWRSCTGLAFDTGRLWMAACIGYGIWTGRRAAQSRRSAGRVFGDGHASGLVRWASGCSFSRLAIAAQGGVMRMAANNRSIDICVCTFRRPELAARCARSARWTCLRDSNVAHHRRRQRRRRRARDRWSMLLPANCRSPIRLRALPGRQHFDRPQRLPRQQHGDFLAFIDDDETASAGGSPNWSGWPLTRPAPTPCSGRCSAVYCRRCAGLDAAAAISTRRCRSGSRGEIRTGYSCNVLLRRRSPSLPAAASAWRAARPAARTPSTSPDGQGRRPHRLSPGARVDEVVPQARAAFDWLGRRRFRFGQTHGKLLAAEVGGMRRLGEVALAAAKTTYSWGAAGLTVFRPVSRNRNALRGVMHAGAVSGLLGGRELQQYGALPAKGLATFTATIAEKSGTE